MTAGSVAIFGEVLADVFPDQRVLGGAPFNVARHLQLFGLQPLMISRTGTDALGDELLQEMERRGMTPAGMQRDRVYPTGQVRVELGHGGHRFEILPEQAYDYICPDQTQQALAVHPPGLAYFGTLAQRGERSRLALRRMLESCACPLFLDINLRAPWYDPDTISASLAAADIVKLNDEELAQVATMSGLADLPDQAQAAELQRRYGLQQVLVTCGAAGSWLLDEGGQVTRAAPVAGLAVVDTVGAGDAFAAVYMLGLLQGWDVQTALQRAGEYAGAMCGVRGAAPSDDGGDACVRRAWMMSG